VEDELLTVAEVPEILKLNPQTIRNWIDAGTLPHVRLGERRVRIWRSDFLALIGESTAGHQSMTMPPKTIWDGVIAPPQIPES
jgi:excisionase family DNA binding protein